MQHRVSSAATLVYSGSRPGGAVSEVAVPPQAHRESEAPETNKQTKKRARASWAVASRASSSPSHCRIPDTSTCLRGWRQWRNPSAVLFACRRRASCIRAWLLGLRIVRWRMPSHSMPPRPHSRKSWPDWADAGIDEVLNEVPHGLTKPGCQLRALGRLVCRLWGCQHAIL